MAFVAHALAMLLSSSAALRVCTTLDDGFNMLSKANLDLDLANVTGDQQLIGFDVDVRREVLRDRLRLPYTVRVLSGYGELQVRTRLGECDVGWAPFYVTARRQDCTPDPMACRNASEVGSSAPESWVPFRCCTDTGVSYLPWTVNALYKPTSTGAAKFFRAIWDSIASVFFLNFVCFLFLCSIVFGHLIWLAEREENDVEFPRDYWNGIDDALWWSWVTVTTVGYGDKSPKTPTGRVVGFIWMLIGISLISILTGHMVSTFGPSFNKKTKIEGVPDLNGLRVCGYPVTHDFYFLRGITYESFNGATVAECMALLRDGTVDVVLMDGAILKNFVRSNTWAVAAGYAISPEFSKPLIGMLFPHGGSYKEAINVGVLSLLDMGSSYQTLVEAWFPQLQASDDQASNEPIQWEIVAPTIALVIIYTLIQAVRTFLVWWLRKEKDRPPHEDGGWAAVRREMQAQGEDEAGSAPATPKQSKRRVGALRKIVGAALQVRHDAHPNSQASARKRQSAAVSESLELSENSSLPELHAKLDRLLALCGTGEATVPRDGPNTPIRPISQQV